MSGSKQDEHLEQVGAILADPGPSGEQQAERRIRVQDVRAALAGVTEDQTQA